MVPLYVRTKQQKKNTTICEGDANDDKSSRNKKSSSSPHNSDKAVKRVSVKDSSTTDSSDSDGQPKPKRSKMSPGGRDDEQESGHSKNDENHNETTPGSPDMFSYSQPYESPEHQSLSPNSSNDDMDIQEMDGNHEGARSRIRMQSEKNKELMNDFNNVTAGPSTKVSPVVVPAPSAEDRRRHVDQPRRSKVNLLIS